MNKNIGLCYMKRTKQNRSKGRRRMTMKRIRRNKVMYVGGIGTINTKDELDKDEAKNYTSFQLKQQQLKPVVILDTRDIQKLKRYVTDNNVFDPSGKIKDEFELYYM